jgi:hypothetical protein
VRELTWDSQSGDLGFPSTLSASLARVFDVFGVFAKELSETQVSHKGVLSGAGLGELLKEIYPASSEEFEEFTLRINKDCVNEESAECLGWGHELWNDLKSAFHWQASRNGEWHTIPNVALSGLSSAEPLIIAVTDNVEGGGVIALKKGGSSWEPLPDTQAKQHLFEELSELRATTAPTAKATDQNMKDIKDGFAKLVSVAKGNRLVGILYRAPGKRGAR